MTLMSPVQCPELVTSHPTPADNVDCKLYSPLQFVHFTEFKQLTAHTPPCYVRSVQRETELTEMILNDIIIIISRTAHSRCLPT